MSIEKELRIMHACEMGAVGVYRGHKCVARYFFRKNLAELDNMRFHEKDHAAIFSSLLKERNARLCLGHQLFFLGGLIYGVAVGFLGLRAIGTSTYTIERIVDEEFDIALPKFYREKTISDKIRAVQLEEKEHRDSGLELAGEQYFLSGFVETIAKTGAYTAKFLASSL
ncbi:MAG: demethoxyubiquinone hydroxylase family protein [Saccharospirillaceae bacterium]|nr:demethoxyubiquinone hydroxylase family protein [Saccharospirillaceae bacterium]MCD8532385.1 demethoxyubiquinone hydroxylase family protein [Saccharospirillaceae bacterium]